MKKLVLSILIYLLCLMVFAQDESHDPKLPDSPNAASLGNMVR